MIRLLLLLLVVLTSAAPASTSPFARVTYEIRRHGERDPGEGPIVLECGGQQARVAQEPVGEWRPGAPKESGHQDFAARRTLQRLEDRQGRRSHVVAEFSALPALEATDETLEILGLPCRKWTATLFSNRIELWSTTATALRGGPRLSLLDPDGLTLRIVVNGDLEFLATAMEPLAQTGDLWPAEPGEAVDLAEYRHRVTQGWVTATGLFQDQPVCFVPTEVDTLEQRRRLRELEAGRLEDGAVLRFAAGTLVLRRVELPQVEGGQLFLELVETSRGDAYDRTGSVFVIPVERGRSFLDALRGNVSALPFLEGRDGRRYQGVAATEDYLPPLELLRFLTPFGVGHFNGQVQVKGQVWADSAVYRQEVTDLLPALRGPVWLGAFIGNYDAGGHEIDLRLAHHPDGRELAPPPEREGWLLPLFNTVNVLEMAGQEYGRLFARDTLAVTFDLPAGVEDLWLRYISTGHGGWGGGDEFNPKPNTILLDGAPVATVTPWRGDCATYRSLNPASGNFWNGVSSSDLSRSGWCPGASAEPFRIPLPGLAPGRHTLRVAIPQGEPEGGSFSAWNVSGTLVGTVARGGSAHE
jgi:hypothetical protein